MQHIDKQLLTRSMHNFDKQLLTRSMQHFDKQSFTHSRLSLIGSDLVVDIPLRLISCEDGNPIFPQTKEARLGWGSYFLSM